MTKLLTETADYDTPGSWGPASKGWPSLADEDGSLRAFVIRTKVVPYGGYVTVEGRLRIHPDYIKKLKSALAQK